MKSFILFGDSMLGRFDRKYILQLEETIQGLTIYNCAVGGFDTRDGIRRASFLAKLNPDYVCLSFGANDASPLKGESVPIEEFTTNFISIIRSFSGSQLILFPCPPVYDAREPIETKKFNDQLIQYNTIIKDLAIKTKSDIIDSETIYSELLEKGENYHLEDGLHLNDFGYQKLIEELIKLIK